MRRKRRKAYRKWKMLNAAQCASQPSSQTCQKNIKVLEKGVVRETSEAVLHEVSTSGSSNGDGDECMSAAITGEQNSSFFPKDEKHSPSDRKTHHRIKNDGPPSAGSQQPGLPVAMFNDSKKALSGKITMQDFPQTVEAFKLAKGKFLTEVKYGAFTVQAATRKSVFCKTGARFPTKRCPTCHQQIWRTATSRHYFPKCKNALAEESEQRVPSTCTGETARTGIPSLNIHIVGKEIKVEYVSKKQNIIINITHPERWGKLSKRRSLSSAPAMKEPVSPQQPHINPEKWQSRSKHKTSDCLHDSSPIADAIPENLDNAVSKKNKPNALPSASDDSARKPTTSQQKVFTVNQATPHKQHLFTEDTLFPRSCDTIRTKSSSNTDLSKTPLEDPKSVDKERKNSSDVQQNITPDSHMQPCTGEASVLLSAVTSIVPLQDGSDYDMCSLSFLNPQFMGEKAANISDHDRKPLTTENCEDENVIFLPSSQSALRSSPSLSPSHWATTHLEPVETPADAFSFNHCAELVMAQEKAHVTEGDIGKATVHSDSCANAWPILEKKSMQSPTLGLPHCSNLASKSQLNSINHSSMEQNPAKDWGNHAEIAGFDRTKLPTMAFITNRLEQRVITQNDKEDAVNSNSNPMAVRNSEESPPSLENAEDGQCHRNCGAQTRENQDEVCFQMDFPPDTSASSCAGYMTEKMFLMERIQTKDADLYHQAETSQANFQQDLAQCQWTISSRAQTEDECPSDSKETSHLPVDILLSPLMQKALKDQNLEINSLRKLSQELSLRGGRASDGSQEEAVDQWARRRQQFKDRKRCSSAGDGSFASNFTEDSITSDDAPSVDFAFRVDIGEKGFYTENFHSAAWVFRGDDGNPEDSPRCLSKKPGPVAVRERTVRLFKGTGDYPWGFRIQFSKPIVVTEVDTNSAAEEAGLQIGDVVLSVNGTEVTSVEHAEAVHLARKGPDILTLVVGSDISRCPNTPWPTCRGYLHKRTQSGFVKGWRKRWFVLKYDGYLHYYKHKKDEEKCPPLEVIKLEGAEVDIDRSLGKPFVFNCIPQSGNRIFCLCATSNQEMKRWLEAMHRAAHPTQQSHVWEDVTLHNSSLPPLAIKNPECLGLLHQLERSTDTWVQHYCILKDGCLYFYSSIRSTQASGGLYLQGYRVSEQTHNFKQAVIELKPPSEEFKTFYFCAENKTENQRWITALKTSIKKWLPLDQAIQQFMNRPLEETRM